MNDLLNTFLGLTMADAGKAEADFQFGLLLDALRLIALNAEDQVAALPRFVVVPDEIALFFHDALLLLPQLVTRGLVPPHMTDPLMEIDRKLSAMTDAADRSVWTYAALANHPDWEWLRERARALLARMGCSLAWPQFTHTRWVSDNST